jgi:3' terminal RNA ribose 2'-O-methyltransferase Hen1
MLLTITTTHQPATDLGYLLHKHPDKLQSFDISFGKAHVFYPEVSIEKCTCALLLDIDTVGMVRNNKGPSGDGFALEQYVNDRPYVASSFLSAAITKTFASALNGNCKDKPELVEVPFPLEVKISVLPVRGNEDLLTRMFEPLGYTIEYQRHPLDATFAEWGQSRYYTVTLKHTITLKALLSHLYVLVPVLDNDKHYWLSNQEVQKLLDKGEGWLENHPEKKFITKRYLKNLGRFANQAMAVLMKDELVEETDTEEMPEPEEKISLHNQRLNAVFEEIKKSGAKTVLDLGCGEGKLLRRLLNEAQFEQITGMDVSLRSLEIATDKLKLARLPFRQKDRIKLIQGSLTYKDKRLEGFDAAALVEVIEHLDPDRLRALERVVFEFSRPQNVFITTPNREYNVKFESMPADKLRHTDHRFEWTRKEFEGWANALAAKYNYTVSFAPLGPVDELVGAPSQMGIFKNENNG